jgi:hypothetical protein
MPVHHFAEFQGTAWHMAEITNYQESLLQTVSNICRQRNGINPAVVEAMETLAKSVDDLLPTNTTMLSVAVNTTSIHMTGQKEQAAMILAVFKTMLIDKLYCHFWQMATHRHVIGAESTCDIYPELRQRVQWLLDWKRNIHVTQLEPVPNKKKPQDTETSPVKDRATRIASRLCRSGLAKSEETTSPSARVRLNFEFAAMTLSAWITV